MNQELIGVREEGVRSWRYKEGGTKEKFTLCPLSILQAFKCFECKSSVTDTSPKLNQHDSTSRDNTGARILAREYLGLDLTSTLSFFPI